MKDDAIKKLREELKSGMFDLGAVDALYVNPWYGGGAQRE